ncbi:hypothetical protein WMY93_017898 [Mugilogobius chulae]|uniref:Uncharacterized protein n=1 Tax=Mugilogobius chulae TaxID=88201 RepID=A0AAW0NLL2_9GOBI
METPLTTHEENMDTQPPIHEEDMETPLTTHEENMDTQSPTYEEDMDTQPPIHEEDMDTQPPTHEEDMDTQPPTHEENMDTQPPTHEEDMDTQPPTHEEDMDTQPPTHEEDMDTQPPIHEEDMDTQTPTCEEDMDTQPPTYEEDMDTQPPIHEEDMDTQPPIHEEEMDTQPPTYEEDMDTQPPIHEEDMDTQPPTHEEDMDTQPPTHEENMDTQQPTLEEDMDTQPPTGEEDMDTQPTPTHEEDMDTTPPTREDICSILSDIETLFNTVNQLEEKITLNPEAKLVKRTVQQMRALPYEIGTLKFIVQDIQGQIRELGEKYRNMLEEQKKTTEATMSAKNTATVIKPLFSRAQQGTELRLTELEEKVDLHTILLSSINENLEAGSYKEALKAKTVEFVELKVQLDFFMSRLQADGRLQRLKDLMSERATNINTQDSSTPTENSADETAVNNLVSFDFVFGAGISNNQEAGRENRDDSNSNAGFHDEPTSSEVNLEEWAVLTQRSDNNEHEFSVENESTVLAPPGLDLSLAFPDRDAGSQVDELQSSEVNLEEETVLTQQSDNNEHEFPVENESTVLVPPGLDLSLAFPHRDAGSQVDESASSEVNLEEGTVLSQRSDNNEHEFSAENASTVLSPPGLDLSPAFPDRDDGSQVDESASFEVNLEEGTVLTQRSDNNEHESLLKMSQQFLILQDSTSVLPFPDRDAGSQVDELQSSESSEVNLEEETVLTQQSDNNEHEFPVENESTALAPPGLDLSPAFPDRDAGSQVDESASFEVNLEEGTVLTQRSDNNEHEVSIENESTVLAPPGLDLSPAFPNRDAGYQVDEPQSSELPVDCVELEELRVLDNIQENLEENGNVLGQNEEGVGEELVTWVQFASGIYEVPSNSDCSSFELEHNSSDSDLSESDDEVSMEVSFRPLSPAFLNRDVGSQVDEPQFTDIPKAVTECTDQLGTFAKLCAPLYCVRDYLYSFLQPSMSKVGEELVTWVQFASGLYEVPSNCNFSSFELEHESSDSDSSESEDEFYEVDCRHNLRTLATAQSENVEETEVNWEERAVLTECSGYNEEEFSVESELLVLARLFPELDLSPAFQNKDAGFQVDEPESSEYTTVVFERSDKHDSVEPEELQSLTDSKESLQEEKVPGQNEDDLGIFAKLCAPVSCVRNYFSSFLQPSKVKL